MAKPLFFLLLAAMLLITSLPASAFTPTAEDTAMMTRIERDSMQYFIRMSDKFTGLTRDSTRPGSPASIAATGFALASVAIGAAHGWIPGDYAKDQLLKTLQFLAAEAEHERGFYYHFLDQRSGRRVWGSEASSIDTALLIAGALVAASYYPGTEIERLANHIYERVDWPWMMNHSDLICMGWKPETGFLPYYWDYYSEHLILQALALASPTNPVPPETWNTWIRLSAEYRNKEVVYSYSGSLFTYQFAQAFIDFRNLNDNGINYFDNSVKASIANLEYSQSHRQQFRTYLDDAWGLSASVGPGGYKAYGAKPGSGEHDGTIAPYAAVAAVVFTPEASIKAMRYFMNKHGEKLYGHYGFKDAYNLDKNWWADEYLGIDQGISVLMLENYLNSGEVWKRFMKTPAMVRWVSIAFDSNPEEVIRSS